MSVGTAERAHIDEERSAPLGVGGSWSLSEVPAAEPKTPGARGEPDHAYVLITGPDGPVAVTDLFVEFDDSELLVHTSDGRVIWTSPWEDMAYVARNDAATLPGYSEGVAVTLAKRGDGDIGIVTVADDPSRLITRILAMAAANGVPAAALPSQLHPVLVFGIILVVSAIVAVFLLAAGHSIAL